MAISVKCHELKKLLDILASEGRNSKILKVGNKNRHALSGFSSALRPNPGSEETSREVALDTSPGSKSKSTLSPQLIPQWRMGMVWAVSLSHNSKDCLSVPQLAGSVWGGGSSELGYVRSWNATENAVEMMALEFHNRLLVLDESTVADKSKSRRGESIFDLLHRISLGQTKARMYESSGQHFDTIALLTSNDSLTSFLDESALATAAANVRLFTIGLPDRATGFFETVPEGFDSVTDALAHIRQVSLEHYAVLSEVFVRRVLNAANTDWAKFLSNLKVRFVRFLKAAKVDQRSELEMRRAKPFALACATGCTAKRFGLLPEDEWGNFLVPIVKAWRYSDKGLADRQPKSAEATIESVLTDKTKRFSFVREASGKAIMSDKQFARFDGFGIRVSGRLCLGIPTSKFKTLFANEPKLIKRLTNENLLHSNDGNRFKKRIRTDENGIEKNDWFYAIRVDEVVLKEACRRSSSK